MAFNFQSLTVSTKKVSILNKFIVKFIYFIIIWQELQITNLKFNVICSKRSTTHLLVAEDRLHL